MSGVQFLAASHCALWCLLALLPAPSALAQTAQSDDVSSFGADFFARSQPSSAYDMVELLPGFRLQEGDAEARGYSGAAGNVLIDGRRPASKEDRLEDLLKRIPAASVDHIELIRSSAAGYDMQGYALIANVVRTRGSRLRGRIEGEYARFPHEYSNTRAAGEIGLQLGERRIDLQGALYREIDDEQGFGSRDRYLPDGTPLRLTDYAQPEGTRTRELSGSYSQPLAGGSFRASALMKDSRMFGDIRNAIHFPAERLIIGRERVNTRAVEEELHYERDIFAGSRMELIGVRRDVSVVGTDTAIEGDTVEGKRVASDAAETIIRAVLRRKDGLLSIELGGEGAINTLDSHVALSLDGVDLPLPAADVTIEEKRAEIFATGTWQIAPALTAETGLRYEASRLTQSGDSALVKSLAYVKPNLLVKYAASPRDQLRLLLAREVGQLDFANFVSDPSLTSGTITAGNKDLEPYSLWRAALTWERAIGAGSIVVSGRHEWVSNVVDRVAVVSPEGVFDSAGNIGSGRRTELEVDATLPLDDVGLAGMTLKGSGLFRRSRVTDPQTGRRRRISGDEPVEATASLTHDLPRLDLRWGVNYVFRDEETEFRIDEVRADRFSGRLDAFIEYKPAPRWTLRLFGKNLTDSPVIRARQVFGGLRGTGDPDFIERRILRSGRYLGLNVQYSFGR